MGFSATRREDKLHMTATHRMSQEDEHRVRNTGIQPFLAFSVSVTVTSTCKNNAKEELSWHMFLVFVGISVTLGPVVRWSYMKEECGRVALSTESRKQKQVPFQKGTRAWYNWYDLQGPTSSNHVFSHNSTPSQWSI